MMTDEHVKTLFREAAAALLVGPPPDLVGIAERRRRTSWLAVALGGAGAAAVIVVGTAAYQGGAESPSGAAASEGGPTVVIDSTAPTTRELSCDDNLIVLMSWETPAPVEASPQELADRFVDPAASERAVLETVGDHYAVAFLIREGGTARAELHLYRDAQGWHMGGWEACNHERVRLQP
jgi:hypothetical protein